MRTFLLNQKAIRTPYYNLAMEEALALQLVSHGLVAGLRFWEGPRSIILGLSEKPEICAGKENLNPFLSEFQTRPLPKKPSSHDPVYIARRASGGGTVVHEPNWNLNFSLFVSLKVKPELYPVSGSYQIFLGLISSALNRQGLSTKCKGKSDLAMELSPGHWKKISGNAQFRKRDCIVQHGTLILDSRLIPLVTELLPHPPEEPDYRKGRAHDSFVTSLPSSFSPGKFKEDLSLLFADYMGVENLGMGVDSSFLQSVRKDTNRLFQEKYANLPYILGE
ncbi:lipoate--protein ligase family protein [Leptospira semungkisensis]|uniref:Lipoate--protein ligase family protein n=1 Tax=Leptospira semungkisensis TaxID=2484985 RepID=A0A4R9FUK0_9LEPT|nr:lipoate--protein ligase family protein [Leptospira semungkisensis]TGK01677.1 lipoate--protein ligase family protein [Leptospira semungkisensis]